MARLLGLFVLFVLGGTASAMAQAWVPYKSEDGRFEIQLPGPPKVTEGFNDLGDRSLALEVQLSASQAFAVMATQPLKGTHLDETAPKELKDMQARVQKSFPGSELLHAAAIDHGKWKGRTFTLRIEGGKLIYQGRIYWAGGRFYQTIAVTDPDSASLPMVGYFMDSFQILRD
ncbi:MAG: hypothetical protein ACYC1L_06305 [Alphaproteobacteria bacterium]